MHLPDGLEGSGKEAVLSEGWLRRARGGAAGSVGSGARLLGMKEPLAQCASWAASPRLALGLASRGRSGGCSCLQVLGAGLALRARVALPAGVLSWPGALGPVRGLRILACLGGSYGGRVSPRDPGNALTGWFGLLDWAPPAPRGRAPRGEASRGHRPSWRLWLLLVFPARAPHPLCSDFSQASLAETPSVRGSADSSPTALAWEWMGLQS